MTSVALPEKMMPEHSDKKKIEVLLGHYIDGSISEVEAEEFLACLQAHPEWKREITDQIFLEVDLRNPDIVEDFSGSDPELPFGLPCECQRAVDVCPKRPTDAYLPRHSYFRLFSSFLTLSILVVGLAISLFFLARLFVPSGANGHFASISKTTNCLWGDSLIRTSPGTRLGPCTLRLEQGIALIHFDCGVAVSLEGPSVFEIKGQKHGILHSGRLLATVESPEGKGFVVDTPDSKITDLGTKFGVYAPQNEPSEIYVLDGSVEVLPKQRENILLLEKGDSLTVGSRNGNNGTVSLTEHQVGTSMGRGKEAWVVSHEDTLITAAKAFPKGVSEPFLHVKTETEEDSRADRKAIFSIDLSSLSNRLRSFSEATLFLSFGPTEIGYGTNVPDATFTVYGLVNEQWDDWSEETIRWDNFPGNQSRNSLDPEIWVPLGQFIIKQGQRNGTVRIKGEKLFDFLRQDTNELVTFAIVCDTFATETYSLVFGFANRFHSELQPPRLSFK